MPFGVLLLVAVGGLDVGWVAPESCPLPDLAAVTSGGTGAAVVRLTTTPTARWLVDLTFNKPFTATRRLEVASCDDARRAASALLQLGLKGAERFVSGEVTPEAPPTPPPLLDEPSPEPSVHGAVRLGALAHAFTLPDVAPRFTLAGALRLGVLELELTVRAGVPATFVAGPTDTARVSIWPAFGGDLAACFAPSIGSFRPAICGTFVGELWSLVGSGVTNPDSGTGLLMSGGARARAAFVFGPGFEVGLQVAARANLRRPVAEFEGTPAVSSGPFSLEAGGWLGWSR
ncbi:MAG: hypothetical protein GQE15_02550 [Archangiaceae bacterium]|nr:hypothetical protein [Archangiaceae bacterium]